MLAINSSCHRQWENIVLDPNGEPIISLITVTNGSSRKDFTLRNDNTKTLNGVNTGVWQQYKYRYKTEFERW